MFMLDYLKSLFPETKLNFAFQLKSEAPNKAPACARFDIPCERYEECMSNIMTGLEAIHSARLSVGSILELDVKINGVLDGKPINEHITEVGDFFEFARKHGLTLGGQVSHEMQECDSESKSSANQVKRC